MKILMYGDSGVGKTTFMMATYGLFKDGLKKYSRIKNASKDFGIRCQDETMSNKLEKLFDAFRTNGVYPPMTDKMSSYQYEFLYDDEKIMEFEWIDFQGETINTVDETSLESKKMREALRGADAILLFLNSNRVLEGYAEDDMFSLYAHLNSCVDTENKKILLMPVFTQCDISYIENPKSFEKSKEILEESVKGFKEMSERNSNLVVVTAPIGCSRECMMDLDYVMLWMMLWGINNDYTKSMQGVQEKYDQAQKDWNEHSYLADMFGLSDKADRARAIMNELKPQVQRLEEIEGIKDAMVTYLNEYSFPTIYKIERRHKADDPFNL